MEVDEIKRIVEGGCIIAVLACKILLATFTPLTIDLAYVMSYYSTFPSLPSTSFISLIVGFWSILPVDHPILSTAWNIEVFHPSLGMYLLVFLMKLPLLVIDLLGRAALQNSHQKRVRFTTSELRILGVVPEPLRCGKRNLGCTRLAANAPDSCSIRNASRKTLRARITCATGLNNNPVLLRLTYSRFSRVMATN